MTRKLIIFIFSLIFVFSASACNFPYQTATPEPTLETIDPDLPLMAVVTFIVEIPEDTPTDGRIFLNVLDEVTGLALNVQRHEMQTDGSAFYTASLPLPVGSIVKYRYSQFRDYFVDEHTTNEQPVRYRIYQVVSPGIVRDIISAWSDTSFSGPTGRLLGQVTDIGSSAPLPGQLVSAGGSQTLTDSDGTFLIEGLPPGTHNLVVYSLDGHYQTFQQGAVVAPNSTTPASIQIPAAEMASVVFTVSLPKGTLSGIPVRMAGNLIQFGNTYADLSGGVSSIASRMPALTSLPDGRYSLAIDLPVGAYIEYKYTLGDGFWNAEHNEQGNFIVRSIVVPADGINIEDHVENWGSSSDAAPVVFNVTVSQDTPDNDFISIQFNPFGWTEPIPMWPLGENHWVYILFSPVTNEQRIAYRFCRNDQCGIADDSQTPGSNTPGRSVVIGPDRQSVEDRVDEWKWWPGNSSTPEQTLPEMSSRNEGFFKGVELLPYFHPSLTPLIQSATEEIHDMGSDWLVFTPTWTYTRGNPPVIEPVAGFDPYWEDSVQIIEWAQDQGLNVALYPIPDFITPIDDWWSDASRDFAWWLVWFERYRSFILHHADLAERNGAKSIILGGEWIRPALPGGTLADGSPSGVLADAETRWRDLFTEVRGNFSGEIFWAMEAQPSGLQLPPFVDAIDKLYLLWSLPLAASPEDELETIAARAARYIDSEIFPLELTLEKPVILALEYAAADGALAGCVPDPGDPELVGCLDTSNLARPNPEIPGVTLDLEDQYRAYSAVLIAINDRPWIDGIVARGFFPGATLQDPSSSIFGKPTQGLLRDWFVQSIPVD